MENLKVAVVSDDIQYCRALAASLINACKDVAIEIYSAIDFLSSWSSYEGKDAYYDNFDIILWAGNEIKDTYGDNIVYVTDKASLVHRDYSASKFSIYK